MEVIGTDVLSSYMFVTNKFEVFLQGDIALNLRANVSQVLQGNVLNLLALPGFCRPTCFEQRKKPSQNRSPGLNAVCQTKQAWVKFRQELEGKGGRLRALRYDDKSYT